MHLEAAQQVSSSVASEVFGAVARCLHLSQCLPHSPPLQRQAPRRRVRRRQAPDGVLRGVQGHVWFHLNFWARRRSTTSSSSKVMIKHFFAEVHYKPAALATNTNSSAPPAALLEPVIRIVEVCTIIGKSSVVILLATLSVLNCKSLQFF